MSVSFSLDAEEALIAACLLHDDFAGLEECEDRDIWYDHLRPVVEVIRRLHAAGEPAGAVFVLYELRDVLDDLEWRGERGEVMILDLLSRRLADPQAWYGRQLGRLVHRHAEERRNMARAEEETRQTYRRAIRGPRGGVEI